MPGPMTANAAKTVCDVFYLAFTVWREARGEPRQAQVAVAHSILNRVSRPKWWGRTIDQVVTKAWQYSSLTDPRDPQLAKAWPLLSDQSWLACLGVAYDVLFGGEPNPMVGADSYYDDSLKGDKVPNWTADARFCGKIGRLNFYDVDHDFEAGTPGLKV